MGERLEHLRSAAEAVGAVGTIAARSSIWETAPVGPDQAHYLNAVLVLDTVLGPRPLLDRCLDIERLAGRIRRERWGPRVIDLDILLYGDAELDTPGLVVPHPRMTERRFVLEPLAEAWPDAIVPGHGAVEHLLGSVTDQEATLTDLEW